MKQALTFSQLPPARKALVRLCQDLNFGSILNLRVINSEVNFDPVPEVVVDVRLDEEAEPRAELELDDFTLRPQVCKLFTQIDALKNGSIEKIVVHAGLPCRVTLRRSLSQKPL
jgi:hypothetical protein